MLLVILWHMLAADEHRATSGKATAAVSNAKLNAQ
jgi:hypothetical protein